MNILTINPGSATVKFAFYKKERKIKFGKIENFKTCEQALSKILEEIGKTEINAVGFRVVHGGVKFTAPALITDSVFAELAKLNELAPLHNPPALSTIKIARNLLGGKLPFVAVFDTMFYKNLPEKASIYALPKEINRKYSIRRFGFHGLAHEYMLERYLDISKKTLKETNLITLQLGSGCSITAVKNGAPMDTSMGFTPLEGLVMRTRCGDIDPTLVYYLSAKEGKSAKEIIGILNNKAGLAGLTGTSGDMRILTKGLQKSSYKRAIDVFVYRIKKYIGAYLAVLNGSPAVVLGGGAGERSPLLRAKILQDMMWIGLDLDSNKNQKLANREGVISSNRSKIKAYVIPIDESVIIRKYTRQVLNGVE